MRLLPEGSKSAGRAAGGVDKRSGNRHIRSPAGISISGGLQHQKDADTAGFLGTLADRSGQILTVKA